MNRLLIEDNGKRHNRIEINRIEAEDLKSVCSSAEGELEPKLCFCQSEILE